MKKLWRAFFKCEPPPADRARVFQHDGGGSNRLFSGRNVEPNNPRESREWRARIVPHLLAAFRQDFPKRPDYKLHEMIAELFGVSRQTVRRDIPRRKPS
jgi:hypothetical protein